MDLLPIRQTLAENSEFLSLPLCLESLHMSIEFYRKAGYHPPWISYYARIDEMVVGVGGFKGPPVNGTVEIGYGTFEPFQNKGVASGICKRLIVVSHESDRAVKITARTLPDLNFSTKILRKNHFIFAGSVLDPEDGLLWQWKYQPVK